MVLNYNKNNVRSGTVTFKDNKNYLNINFGYYYTRIVGPIGYGNSNWEILKLTMKEFKISTDFNGKNYKISFKKLSL